MAYVGKSNGIIVLRHHQVEINGQVGPHLVVYVRVLSDKVDFPLNGNAPFVNGDKLFVQVVKGRARRFQPVLENRNIAYVLVVVVNILHALYGKFYILIMFLGGEFAGVAQLRVKLRVFNVMIFADDKFVTARKKCVRHLYFFLF